MYLISTCILLILDSNWNLLDHWRPNWTMLKPLTSRWRFTVKSSTPTSFQNYFDLPWLTQLRHMEPCTFPKRLQRFHTFETCCEPGGDLQPDSNGRGWLWRRERASVLRSDGGAWMKRAVGVWVQRRQRRYQREMEGKSKSSKEATKCGRTAAWPFPSGKTFAFFTLLFSLIQSCGCAYTSAAAEVRRETNLLLLVGESERAGAARVSGNSVKSCDDSDCSGPCRPESSVIIYVAKKGECSYLRTVAEASVTPFFLSKRRYKQKKIAPKSATES